jgi:hypothetical protein
MFSSPDCDAASYVGSITDGWEFVIHSADGMDSPSFRTEVGVFEWSELLLLHSFVKRYMMNSMTEARGMSSTGLPSIVQITDR